MEIDHNSQGALLNSPATHSSIYEWSFRVPSPPRIMVPPPAINHAGQPDIHFHTNPVEDFESNIFANSEFLEKVTYGDYLVRNNMLDWKYEQRREAQKILPFLYLGPLSAARNRKFLQQEGITMVIAVRDTQSAHAKLLSSKAAGDISIDSTNIDVTGNQELIAAFPRTIEVINSHLSAMYRQRERRKTGFKQEPTPFLPGKVLVYCESGNERSAAVVAAYILAMFSFDLVTTIQVVQTQRFCVAFDDSLRFLLQSYESIIKAKRDVAKSRDDRNSNKEIRCPITEEIQSQGLMASGKLINTSSKRRLDDFYENDTEMADDDENLDSERFEKREGFAPFKDSPQ